jgi:hypothetical protein
MGLINTLLKKEQLTMRDGTRVVRAGLPRFAQGEPFLPGPTFANPYYLAGDPSSSPYSYGRYHNPTWTQYDHRRTHDTTHAVRIVKQLDYWA